LKAKSGSRGKIHERTCQGLIASSCSQRQIVDADAYGLTDRERKVTALVAQGLSTNAIAQRLYLAPYTVQDHLKSIFERVGVGSRGELVARLYLDHYASRL